MYLSLSFHCDHQIWRWGGGSLRNYYKPKQMKNLYDVETGVKKDVVGIHLNLDLNERIFFQVLFRYEDPTKIVGRCWIGLACIPVWPQLNVIAIYYQFFLSSLGST